MSKRRSDPPPPDRRAPQDVPVELFQPVGAASAASPPIPRPHPSGRSRKAVQQLATKRRAQRADLNPHAMVRARAQALARAAQKDGYGLAPPLSLDTQIRMASELVSQFHQEAKGTTADGTHLTANGRKQAAVAWAVATDKLTILQGRPTEVLRVEEAEAQRPAILELVRKLAAVREARAESPS